MSDNNKNKSFYLFKEAGRLLAPDGTKATQTAIVYQNLDRGNISEAVVEIYAERDGVRYLVNADDVKTPRFIDGESLREYLDRNGAKPGHGVEVTIGEERKTFASVAAAARHYKVDNGVIKRAAADDGTTSRKLPKGIKIKIQSYRYK